MHRRSVYRYRVGRATTVLSALISARGVDDRPRGGDLNGGETRADPTVLVIDPVADRPDEPGFATITAASMAERLGCRSAAVTATPDGDPALAIDGFALDLVVLVLEGGWSGQSSTWSTGAWGISASLTATYRAAGLPGTGGERRGRGGGGGQLRGPGGARPCSASSTCPRPSSRWPSSPATTWHRGPTSPFRLISRRWSTSPPASGGSSTS